MKKINKKISLLLLPFFFTASKAFAITSPNVTVKNVEATTSVKTIIDSVSTWLLGFAGAVAVLFIIFSGLQMVTAAGNKERYEAAKKTLGYAVLGLLIIVLALVIVRVVINIPTAALTD